MRRYLFLFGVLILFALMAGAVFVREIAVAGETEERQAETVPVQIAEVELHEFADTVEAIGTVRANESVSVTANVSDTISRISFESGQQVQAGDILVELADTEEAAALTEARASLNEAQRTRARINELAEQGAASGAAVDEAEAAYDRAQAQIDALQARLADRVIRAPFAGVIGLRNVSLGELVSPGDVVATLDDTSVVKLDFTVPERFFSTLDEGQQIRAEAAAYPGEVFSGRIAEIDSRIDPVTRAVTVRAIVPNSENRLRPGMLLTVETRRDVRESPAIPEIAVMRNGTQAFVYTVSATEDSATAKVRYVSLGIRDGLLIEVTEGLQAGNHIVSEGTHKVRAGDTVQIASQYSDEDGNPEIAETGA